MQWEHPHPTPPPSPTHPLLHEGVTTHHGRGRYASPIWWCRHLIGRPSHRLCLLLVLLLLRTVLLVLCVELVLGMLLGREV